MTSKKTAAAVLAVWMACGGVSWAVSWENNLDAALKKAKGAGKPVMADFYTDWCGWCKKLDSDVYANPDVDKLAEGFICVKVNCGKDRAPMSKYGIKGFPTIIFFDPAGSPMETIVGYRGSRDFLQIMGAVLSRAPSSTGAQWPEPSTPAKPVIKKKPGEGEFELQGIMLPKAIVNDKIVSAGQMVNGAKVVKVTEGGVKLLYKGEEITLGMVTSGIEKDADAVYLKNGRKLTGIVLKEGTKIIELETGAGTVSIGRPSIKKIQYATVEALDRLREKWKPR